jgi:GTP-binding protein HflX
VDVLPGAVPISAVRGDGLDNLLQRIEEELDAGTEEVSLLIPFAKYALADKLRKLGSVLSQEHVNEGVILRWRAEKEQIQYACKEGARLIQEEI